MDSKRLPQTCQWAEPTLYQPWPMWLDAWAWPWSCRADGAPKLLPTTSDCQECPRWERRDQFAGDREAHGVPPSTNAH